MRFSDASTRFRVRYRRAREAHARAHPVASSPLSSRVVFVPPFLARDRERDMAR
jgi:hypothetical protein|tara:strand:- start:504 stop:665 length:162 start_codon:yes stop_codon:yes gene_type:complete